MSRWRMYKLGFLNFWLYDREEFLLHDGHILLRGNNASGKSITTQSFIPFILDGDRRPERLDPFGSRDRKMEFYLLGDNDRDESTGYLYLEFKSSDAEEYRTVGVGMRAQKGKGIDFWGFCLCDGRRIGPEGIQLYEKLDGQILPLSKQKLRNLISDPDNWAGSPTQYKKLVNDRIFGFRDPRQYDQLIQLLIMVRTPKLSKEAFRPTEVKRTLNSSLQVLTDDDLSAMVATMERMDALEDTLKGYHTAIQDARTIGREYSRYNQYILGHKGQAYLDALGKTQRLKHQLQNSQADLAGLERGLKTQEERRSQSAILLGQARAQRAAMGDDDLSAKREQLKQAEDRRAQAERHLNQGTQQWKETQERITRQETKLRDLRQEKEDAHVELRRLVRELNDENEILELGDEHHRYIRDIQAESMDPDRQTILAAVRHRKQQIGEVLGCLRRLEGARKLYDDASMALDQADTAVRQAGVVLGDAQRQEQDERDQLLERMAQWREQTRQLELPQESWLEIRRALTVYRAPADWSPIRNRIDNHVRQRETQLGQEKLQAEDTLSKLLDEREELSRELKRVQNQPDPIPARRDQIQATRLELLMRGIPCAPLYELVDFAPGVSQDEQDLLEAQLLDAGLLDALVVPEEERPAIRNLLTEYPDRFLIPGPAAAQPIESLVPDGPERFREAVSACLRGISHCDLEADTALLPDGQFRCGMVCGHSRAEAPAGFVGAAARRANRERQIHALEEQLAVLNGKIQAAQTIVDALSADLALLETERAGMPTAEELDQALELLDQARRDMERAREEQERKQAVAQAAKQAWSAVDQECRTLSAGLPYARTIPAYEEAQASAEDYQELLNGLESCQKDLAHTLQATQDLEETIDQYRDDLDTLKRSNEDHRQTLCVEQAAAEGLRAYLDRPENQARAQRLKQLEDEIDHQDQENRDAETQCAVLARDIVSAENVIKRYDQDMLEAVMDEDELEHYFSEDLALGFSGLDYDQGLEQCARQAVSKVQAADRERTPERVGEALRNNYLQHNNSLLKYHPEIKTIFDAPSKPAQLRERISITVKKGGKELSLYQFIQSLQEDIDTTALLLEERDRELFENILTETISQMLRARIEESTRWVRDMTALMGTLSTSMGLTFSLDWKAKKAEEGGELDTAQLVTLLNKDRALLTQEDSQRVSVHFRSKIKRAREKAREDGLTMNYADLIRDVLDYRNWYEFHLFYLRDGETKKELTDRVFNRFSGGEKAMAMYVPLFAAVSAQYQKGGERCPRLLALDETFAGVDDQNISAMFDLVRILEFDYIMNSQVLWGCYACVRDLDIAELHRPSNASVVSILRYHWNGVRREMEDDIL